MVAPPSRPLLPIVSCVQGRSDGVVGGSVLSVPRGVSHRCTPHQWRTTHVVRLTRASRKTEGHGARTEQNLAHLYMIVYEAVWSEAQC